MLSWEEVNSRWKKKKNGKVLYCFNKVCIPGISYKWPKYNCILWKSWRNSFPLWRDRLTIFSLTLESNKQLRYRFSLVWSWIVSSGGLWCTSDVWWNTSFSPSSSDEASLSEKYQTKIIISAVASNRPTEALASVISFTFVVYSHYKLLIPRKRTQPWTDCLGHKSSMDIASVISFFWLRPW